jgi:hypothetical protein
MVMGYKKMKVKQKLTHTKDSDVKDKDTDEKLNSKESIDKTKFRRNITTHDLIRLPNRYLHGDSESFQNASCARHQLHVELQIQQPLKLRTILLHLVAEFLREDSREPSRLQVRIRLN